MISWLMHRMTNVVMDAIVNRVLQDPYTRIRFPSSPLPRS